MTSEMTSEVIWSRTMESREIYQSSVRHFLQPVHALLDDPDVSEILVNGPSCVYFERRGILHRSEARFRDAAALEAAAQNIAEYVGRTLDENHHSVDARLPDGSRVHLIRAPASRQGTCMSIRRFQKSSFVLEKLVAGGSLSEEAAEYLQLCVKLHKNMVIAGGTGTGKTSMLNALSAAIPEDERIIVIEDSSELQLRQPHTVYLEAQQARPDGGGAVSIRDLFVDSLRMRPDRIVVGEVRRGEALDLIQSMISGHAGALTTVHATTARDAAIRLETLSLMSDVSLPVYVARAQVASALHVVLQITRLPDGSRRVSHITECLGLGDDNNYRFSDIYQIEVTGRDEEGRILSQLKPTGRVSTFAEEPWGLGLGPEVQLTKAVFPSGQPARV
jgi:pilus assembly protein CpaF